MDGGVSRSSNDATHVATRGIQKKDGRATVATRFGLPQLIDLAWAPLRQHDAHAAPAGWRAEGGDAWLVTGAVAVG